MADEPHDKAGESPGGAHPSAPYWTGARRELLGWLGRNAPSLAELYEGAVELLFGRRVPGWTRLVSHAVREIAVELPQQLPGGPTRDPAQIINKVQSLAILWRKNVPPADGTVPPHKGAEGGTQAPSSGIVIPRKIFRKLDALFEECETRYSKAGQLDEYLFLLTAPENKSIIDSLRPVLSEWRSVVQWFVDRAHDRGAKDDGFDASEFRRQFEAFEQGLGALVRAFYATVKELDDVLAEANAGGEPSPELVQRAVLLIARREQYWYFFDRLENPKWIRPLYERKRPFFRTPPAIVPDQEHGLVKLPVWPESRYLARMARHEPKLVLDVILGMEATDNSSVHSDLVDAALAMPAEIAVALADRARKWAEAPSCYSLPEKLGELVKHLAAGGQFREAIGLARELLKLLPEPEEETRRVDEEFKFIQPPPQPRSRLAYYTYVTIAADCAPVLVRAAGIEGFGFLCDMLDTAIRFSSRHSDDLEPEDFSHIWRKEIDGHPPQFARSFEKLFTTLVRDAAEQLVTEGHCGVVTVVDQLEARGWHVFRRIALHVLRVFREREEEGILALVEDRLTDKSLFGNRSMRREYDLLLRDHGDDLEESHRDLILAWIEEGPDVEGLQGSAESIERYVRHWQLERLRPLEKVLPPEWRERYQELHEEFGDERIGGGVVWMGNVAPRSPAELKGMSPKEIIGFLRSWRPEVDVLRPWLPSVPGLEGSLTTVIAENPDLFRDHYEELQGVEAAYVRAILSGLVAAAKANVAFHWDPLLRFCDWIAAQPRQIGDPALPIWESDPDWGWTRSVLAELISEGLKDRETQIPFGLRDRIWSLIEVLAKDPDPAPEREAAFREGNDIDVLYHSKQSIRAQAVRLCPDSCRKA